MYCLEDIKLCGFQILSSLDKYEMYMCYGQRKKLVNVRSYIYIMRDIYMLSVKNKTLRITRDALKI